MRKLYIPETLDLERLIQGTKFDSPVQLDKLHYFISLVYEQRMLYKIREEYVPLKALYLRKVLRDQKPYRDVLEQLGILGCDHRYVQGQKSFGYKILPPYSEVKCKEVEFYSKSVPNILKKWARERLPNTKIHNKLYFYLTQLELDYEKASKEISNLTFDDYITRRISISKFKNKDFFMYSDDYGRIHSNLTNLKSSLRKFLTVSNNKLFSLDISNSQPLLLLLSIPSLLLAIRCARGGLTGDLDLYRGLVEGGSLYDYLMEMSKRTNEDRKAFKKSFFRDTLFGKRVSKNFLELFPTVGNAILEIKRKDYRRLAWMLQRAESSLIINRICGRFIKSYPNAFIATIHDSFLTIEEYTDKLKEIVIDEFKQLQLNPTVKITC